MGDARLSQLPIEVALLSDAPLGVRLSQLAIEVLVLPPPPVPTTVLELAQVPLEVGLLSDAVITIALAQAPIELLVFAVDPGWRFTIDGVNRTPLVDSLNLVFILNERARASAVLGDTLPPKFAEVLSTAKDGFTKMFGGLIMTRGFAGRNQYDPTFTTTIECADYWIYTDSVYVTLTYNAPVLLKTVLQDLVDLYLAPYGIAVDFAQADGPELAPFSWQAKRASDAIRELSERTAWVARLNAYKFLRLFIPGTDPAPFALTEAAPHCQELGWIDSDRGGGLPVNKVTVIAGPAGVHPVGNAGIGGDPGGANGERHYGDGVTRVFPLYAPFVTVIGAVYIDSLHSGGGGFPLGICGVDIDPETGGEFKYCYSAADNAVHQRADQAVILADDFLALAYYGSFPFTVFAATGETPVIELVEPRPDVVSIPAAQEIAASLLASFGAAGAETRELAIVTDEDGFEPGQALTVALPVTRGVEGAFVITEVAMTIVHDPDPPSAEAYWQYTLKATEATAYQGSYLDDWRRLTGGGGAASATGAGGGVPTSGLHAATHMSGGSDAIPLDALGPPNDTVVLDVSTALHGLAPKITGDDGAVLTKAGAAAVWAAITPPLSASVFFYRIDTSATGVSDPGAGKLRYNHATQASATTMIVDWLTDDGFDAHILFSLFGPTTRFLLQEKDLAVVFQEWEITAPATILADYFTVPVSLVSSGGAAVFTHNQRVAVIILPP